jgi:hypothetical protein
MRKRAYLLGREMIWSNVAYLFMESFQRARRSQTGVVQGPAVRGLDQRGWESPRLRLEHLLRMTDSTGILQHATYTIPNFREGYCTDDNARALVVGVRLEELGEDRVEVQRATTTYAAFLDHAFDQQTGRWRNFLSFDRRWLEEEGSEDSLGRTIWALGTCVGRSKRRDLQCWAARLFEPALRAVAETTSPRAWASALIGIHEYLRRLSGDRLANQVRDELTARLVALYRSHGCVDWPWFEDVVAYGNAALSHALILSGRWTSHGEAFEIGLRSLSWLSRIQRSPKGWFRAIGNNGFYRRGHEPAEFDQQPIEAGAMVSAAIEAYGATDDPYWWKEARLAFEWFLGRNDLGLPLYDARAGGCCDGLHEDRVNQNQGAESTLSWLMSLAEMKLLEGSLAAFEKAPDTDRARPAVATPDGHPGVGRPAAPK